MAIKYKSLVFVCVVSLVVMPGCNWQRGATSQVQADSVRAGQDVVVIKQSKNKKQQSKKQRNKKKSFFLKSLFVGTGVALGLVTGFFGCFLVPGIITGAYAPFGGLSLGFAGWTGFAKGAVLVSATSVGGGYGGARLYGLGSSEAKKDMTISQHGV